jgi:hypothetical protein
MIFPIIASFSLKNLFIALYLASPENSLPCIFIYEEGLAGIAKRAIRKE